MAEDKARVRAHETEEDEQDYNSASDEDFNPDGAAAEDSSSSSEDEAPSEQKTAVKGKKKRAAPAAEDLDSGDEVTIQARSRAKKQKGSKSRAEDEDILVFSDDEGGEVGLIKTRAQRRTEHQEHRKLAKTDGANIDVDSIWARLSSAPIGREIESTLNETSLGSGEDGKGSKDDFITIKRTYKFAGEVHTEEKRVLKSSKEAQVYLAQQNKKDEAEKENDTTAADTPEAVDNQAPIRRPLRRPSKFDPNPSGWVKALPPEHQLTWPRKDVQAAVGKPGSGPQPIPQRVKASDLKAQKFNTVDKSRVDWAGYVDKEGIAEELDEYGKAKEGYLGRMDFLQRVDERQEDTRREVRLANAQKPPPAVVE